MRKIHPLKIEIQKRRIKQIDMCFELGLFPSRINLFLNGSMDMPAHVEKRINDYIKQWDAENG